MSDKIVGSIIAIWIACFVLGIGATGVAIWAIIRLVNHFT